MTKRLEDVIKQLTPQQVEQLTTYAESMVPSRSGPKPGDLPSWSWIGCMKDAPERNGVEAAKKANEIRLQLLQKHTNP